jgi:hypothetical protein
MNKGKLNIIWFLVDAVRTYRTGLDDRDRLDLMDKVAKESVEFTSAITSAPSSIMSVAAMMTGCPAYQIARDYDSFKFDPDAYPSLPQILKNNGYHIYSIIFFREGREKFINLFEQVDRQYWPSGLSHTEKYWSNDNVNAILFNILKDGLREPFFLFVHYNVRQDPKTSDKVELAVQRFKESGVYDRSIFILCSDHGYPDPRRGMGPQWFKQRGLRHDLVITDDNILIPLYVRYPGVTPKKIETVVSTLDITPTILDFLGLELDQRAKTMMRGRSLKSLLNGTCDPCKFEHRKIRVDTRFLMQSDRVTAIRDSQYKYIIYHNTRCEEFYDIKNDPFEEKNLVHKSSFEKKVEEFRKEFHRQEEDYLRFHFQYLTTKFQRQRAFRKKREDIYKILVIDCSQLESIPLLIDVLRKTFVSDFVKTVSLRQINADKLNRNYDLVVVVTPNILTSEYKKAMKIARKLSVGEVLAIDSNMEVTYPKRWSVLPKLLYARRKFFLWEPYLLFKYFLIAVKKAIKKRGLLR